MGTMLVAPTNRVFQPNRRESIRRTQIVTMSGAWSVWPSATKNGECQWNGARHALKDYELLTCNLRGHDGKSSLNGVSLYDYEDDLVKFLELAGPSHLMVHSMAGVIGQAVTNRVPELVKSLVLVASAPPGVKGIKGTTLNWRFMRPRYILALLRRRTYSLKPEDIRFVCGNKVNVPLGPESGLASWQILRRSYPVKKIESCPVLVIAAERDQLMSEETETDIRRFHNARYFKVRNASHMVHCEPESDQILFNEVRSWLRSFRS